MESFLMHVRISAEPFVVSVYYCVLYGCPRPLPRVPYLVNQYCHYPVLYPCPGTKFLSHPVQNYLVPEFHSLHVTN